MPGFRVSVECYDVIFHMILQPTALGDGQYTVDVAIKDCKCSCSVFLQMAEYCCLCCSSSNSREAEEHSQVSISSSAHYYKLCTSSQIVRTITSSASHHKQGTPS